MKNDLKKIVRSISADKLIFKADGTVKAKLGYYYTFGNDEDKFAEKIKRNLEAKNVYCQILETSNHYNSWPKDSWFEVIFKANFMSPKESEEWFKKKEIEKMGLGK